MVSVLFLLLQSAAMVPPNAAAIDDDGTITVTATQLPDLAAQAEACAKQLCPTRKDIAVTVAYASALFDEGNYRDAKRLLAGAVTRTRDAAKAEPIAVSTLYQAQATLASHEGDQDIVRDATWASANVLREGLPDNSLPQLTAELRLADWQLRTGDKTGAIARYADIAARAAAAGHGAIGDVASLRRAVTVESTGRTSEAMALLDSLAARPGADAAELRRAALSTAARLATRAGRTQQADAYVALLAAEPGGAEPVLISSAELPRPGRPDTAPFLDGVGLDRGARGSDLAGLRWVDIGYRILPDGRVADIRFVRGSARLAWAQPLLGYIGSRRYTPFAGSDGVHRVERYTLTADYMVPSGSLIRRRLRNPRFEVMPMTVSAAAETGH
ncbi:hypothetical protein [Polymorphobacter fuscus]|uniref:Tetratricopeptide repeat protein n=1 Tax=Sandarakinorhabdus fusca TaxID=1439888 RepID=A0A7C9GPJ7_9SPHN|nr:hypothetical protein [Polymorphobacter fuscus]KAB7646363.1 hypothetical protein F9290_09990 [Polymorphobacter fuscus]MQT17592.1 hypothetical protein [Polymorphobacter fuscus]NJC09865.1 hypothetical protein [Polymorphobacter fuscus]